MFWKSSHIKRPFYGTVFYTLYLNYIECLINIINLKMNIEPLIAYFNNYLLLSEEEMAVLQEVFDQKKVRRRQFILQEGDICKLNTFVVEGCFRMYFVDENGKEHNLQFAVENWWIGDIGIFTSYSHKISWLGSVS